METWGAVRLTGGVGRGLLGQGLFGEREELSRSGAGRGMRQGGGTGRGQAGEREAAEALGRGKL